MQEFEWLPYARGKSLDHNVGKHCKCKWNLGNIVWGTATQTMRCVHQSSQEDNSLQEFEWLSYGRGKSVDYNEAKLRKQKWNVANKVVKKAMRQRRAAVQSRDSEACGDITQTLVRMMPGQGMLPDGFAG